MPHECTNCDRTFPDGSKEMLSGCPDCGGNKFRYRPDDGRLEPPNAESGTASDSSGGSGPSTDPTPDSDGPAGSGEPTQSEESPPGLRDPSGSRTANTVSSAASTLRDLVGGSEPPEDADVGGVDPDPIDRTPSPGVEDAPDPDDGEDSAQASARSSMVDPEEIAAGSDGPTADAGATVAETDTGGADADGPETPDAEESDDDSNLAQLREELNEQFESIKIVEPGQYELNLMELYDRDEYIISLMEDGRYVIEVPETWRDDDL